MKRPLPVCGKDDNFTKVDEEMDANLAFRRKTAPTSMSVNKIFNRHNPEASKAISYKEKTIEDKEFRKNKERVNIDNAAEILNVSMPTDGHEQSPPMKLKPQFWSKFTKTTTLPVKIDTQEI